MRRVMATWMQWRNRKVRAAIKKAKEDQQMQDEWDYILHGPLGASEPRTRTGPRHTNGRMI